MLLKDSEASKPGYFAPTHSTQAAGLESQAQANQNTAEFGQYFAPVMAAHPGLTTQDLVNYFQQNPTTANQNLVNKANSYVAQVNTPDAWYDTLFKDLALATTVGIATAGIGATAGAAAGAAASSATGSAAAGSIAAGAVTGAGSGALSSALTGQNVGKGALTGAVGGGVAGAAAPLASSLNNAGLNQTVANGLVKVGSSAATGALGAGIHGGDAGAGALSGAEHGAINAGTGAVAGSIFNSGNTVNPSLTQSSNPSMSVDPSQWGSIFDPSTVTPVQDGSYNPYNDPNSSVFNGGSSTPGDTSAQYQELQSLLGGVNPNYQASYLQDNSGAGLNQNFSGGTSGLGNAAGSAGASLLSKLLGSSGGSSGNSSSLLGSLSSLLGGSGNSSLLSQLLGAGATGIGGMLQSNAAKQAAGQFGQQTQYTPYSTTTGQGTASFNGHSATFDPSQATMQQQGNLGNLVNSSANSLAGGQQAAAQNYYNQLQASQADANNKMYQNNLDSQFGKGILASTAGQYQSQAALANIGQQQLQDQVAAQNFGQNQQQQQLAQLTAGLNGQSSMNNQQLQQLGLGGTFGSQASSANNAAYQPSLAANSGSSIGNFLTGLGNQQSTANTNNNLLSILGQLKG